MILKAYKQIAVLLVVIGAINWGLVGLLGLNLVSSLLGVGSALEKIVYILVGVAGLYVAWVEWGGAKK